MSQTKSYPDADPGWATVFCLHLEENGDAPYGGVGINPHRHTTIRFVLHAGSSVCLFNPKLCTNYPIVGGQKFSRDKWIELPSCDYNGDKDWFTDLDVHVAGSFEYQLTWTDKEGTKNSGLKGHFVINPSLTICGKSIRVGHLCIQTVITKCLGPFSRWENHFSTAARLGYNMIHMTPIQELGASRSAYSLYDQHMISNDFFPGEKLSEEEKMKRISNFFLKAENEIGLLTLGDLVLNHTANNSPWLSEHPEATYNEETAPHLRPAIDLDEALKEFSRDIVAGKYKSRFDLTDILCENDIYCVRQILLELVFPALKLWEYFVLDVEEAIYEFKTAYEKNTDHSLYKIYEHVDIYDDNYVVSLLESVGVRSHPSRVRGCHKLDMTFALALYGRQIHTLGDSLEHTIGNLRRHIDSYNLPRHSLLDSERESSINAICGSVRYEFFELRNKLSEKRPLVWPYFVPITVKGSGKVLHAACNGWIFGGNALEDFAAPSSKAYLRRDIVIWGDSIKLRYGNSPTDSPWLWNYMTTYAEEMARLYHGVRLDNCHSTPLHVAGHIIDAARAVRPELYVIAELFTGSTDADRLYISKLGINSLIREVMNAHSPPEMSRYCYLYGGKPVGSVTEYYSSSYYCVDPTIKSLTRDFPTIGLREPPALFFDCTHDNEPPTKKFHPASSLCNAALTWMVDCPVGTVRGYDEILPERIDLVKEKKKYGTIQEDIGMVKARDTLNKLHSRLESEGYTEQHTHQQGTLIIIQRHNPDTHHAVFTACRTAYYNAAPEFHDIVRVPGKISKILAFYSIEFPNKGETETEEKDHNIIQGMQCTLRYLGENDKEELQKIFSHEKIDKGNGVDNYEEIKFSNFPVGSVLIFEAELPDRAKQAVQNLGRLNADQKLWESMKGLTETDFQYLFYCCENEERDITMGQGGCYTVPKMGALPYAGITSVSRTLDLIRKSNDMGHPLFDNLRAGNWLMDYILHRLQRMRKYNGIYLWLKYYFDEVKALPRHFVPKYFDRVIMKYFLSGTVHILQNLMSTFIANSANEFIHQLAMTSVQMIGCIPNAPLIDPSLADFKSPLLRSIAAGLPHFSSGYMRTWGRDTFIALRGLLLVPGRFQAAKEHLIGFAASLRHGLIPNLLDGGRNPRYNARDATWWFLQALQDYCKMAPHGLTILKEIVPRLFPWDNYYYTDVKTSHHTSMAEIVQEIMQSHAKGIDFRERNAGPQIDDKMQDQGFNILIRFDPHTGFIYGGNQFNCGTWMDKMGESKSAGNHGIPATPRDGAAIEIMGLLKSTTRWLSEISKQKSVYPHTGINLKLNPYDPSETVHVAFSQWDQLIKEQFEKHFWVPSDPNTDSQYSINKSLVNKRGIYKDTFGSKTEWSDYQLRPNQCVAMVVAPELFNPEHARAAISNVEKHLLGPVGMKTLDESDYNYRPNYDGHDSNDYSTAKGFNYHQGPEWVWPFGWFLRAKMIFAENKFSNQETQSAQSTSQQQQQDLGSKNLQDKFCSETALQMKNQIQKHVKNHRAHIASSPWNGLPELTNQNGSFCFSSCPTQAWSSASLLEAFYDLYQYESQAIPITPTKGDKVWTWERD